MIADRETRRKVEAGLRRDIAKAKKKLVAKAKRKGLYENFGQKEYRELDDKYSDWRYDAQMSNILNEFFHWAGTFDDRKLKEMV